MAAITICSDFGAQKNKVSHCFHCFPIYFPWSDGTRCHDLSFLKETKNNCVHAQLRQINGSKIQEDQESPTATSGELGAKTVSGAEVHATCTQQHQRDGQTTLATPPAWVLDTPLPSSHIRNQLTPTWGPSKGVCYLFLLPSATAGAPTKLCLNSLTGLLSISIVWGRSRTMISIKGTSQFKITTFQVLSGHTWL